MRQLNRWPQDAQGILTEMITQFNPVLRRSPVFVSFRAFQLLLLTLAGFIVALFLFEAVRSLPVTGENIYPESAGVLTAQRWAHGSPLYQDYRQFPYLVTPFPPLWYALMAIPVKLGLTTLDSLTLYGRMLSLVFVGGIAVLGYALNRRLELPSLLALVTPALYLSFPVIIPWAVTARPDFSALFLSLLTIYWVGAGSRTAFIYIAGIAAALAFLRATTRLRRRLQLCFG